MTDSFEYIQKMVKFAEGIIGLAQDHGVMPKKPGRKAASEGTKVVHKKRKKVNKPAQPDNGLDVNSAGHEENADG